MEFEAKLLNKNGEELFSFNPIPGLNVSLENKFNPYKSITLVFSERINDEIKVGQTIDLNGYLHQYKAKIKGKILDIVDNYTLLIDISEENSISVNN